MDIAFNVVLQFLKEISIPISTEEELFNICMVSTNYNEEVSRIVAQSIAAVGINGTLSIVESPIG